MVEMVEYIVKQLVDKKDDVKITLEGDVINVRVDKSDMGKIIGKQGRIAKAIRTLVKSKGMIEGRRYTLEILED